MSKLRSKAAEKTQAIKFLCVLSALTLPAYGQGAHYENRIIIASGNDFLMAQKTQPSVADTLVYVCTLATRDLGKSCAPVPIYSDIDLTHPLPLPLKTDAQGNFGFFALPGNYSYVAINGVGQKLTSQPFSILSESNAQVGSSEHTNKASRIHSPTEATGKDENPENITESANKVNLVVPGVLTLGSVSALPGFIQKGSSTVLDRDDQLRLTLNPEQFGAAGTGSGENGDDCAAINLAIENAVLGSGLNTPKVLHLNGRNYRCTKANYQVLMPRDFGDYSGTSAGAGAQFSLNIVNGSIQSCDVSGGTGYNPKGWVIGQIKDATYRGSGGSVFALTDNNGVPIPRSCVVDSAGVNYPPTGVDVYSFAQGADGASIIGTLSGGTFISAASISNNTGMPQGNGYRSLSFGLPAGLVCAVKPQFKGTVGTSGLSTSALVSVSIATAGSKCTYNGNASAKVPIWIGESTGSGNAQATNIAPSSAVTIGCAIQLRAGVSIEGDGGTIQTDWQTGVYGANQIIALCDAYGNQAQNIGIRNVHLSAPVGIWLSGATNNFNVENVTEEYATPRFQGLKTYIPGSGGGLFLYAAQTGVGTVIENISNYAPGGVVIGGQYTSRGEFGLGSMGGTNVSSGGGTYTYQFGGSADGLIIDNFRQYQHNGNNYNADLDQFFERFVWHGDLTSATSLRTTNGRGFCPTTLPPNIRSVDYLFGATNSSRFQCYRGISDRSVTILSRSPYVSQHVTVSNLWQDKSYRSPIIASVTNSRFSMVNMSALGLPYSDPYIALDTNAVAVIENPTNLPSGPVNHFEAISNADTGRSHFTTTLLGTSFSDNRTSLSSWEMVTGMPSGGRIITIQNTFNKPGSLNFTHGLGTPNPISNCYSTSGASSPTVVLIAGDLNNVAVSSSTAATVVCVFQFAPAPGNN